MTSEPVYLAIPNWQQPRALITDASRNGCGFIIVNVDQKGKHKFLAYGGRLWSKCESQWSVSELELACIVYALENYSTSLLVPSLKYIQTTCLIHLFKHYFFFSWQII